MDETGARIAREVFGDGYAQICRYVERLSTDGVLRGLIGPRETDRLWSRHVLNSVAIAGLIGEQARLADIGSGAGLPGIPLAIARPDIEVTLIEPQLRRCAFLLEVIDELGLDKRVYVVRGRSEEIQECFDVVTARAVAPLKKLIGWTRQLFVPTGELLALKGASAEQEIADAATVLAEIGANAELVEVRAHQESAPTRVVRVRS